MKLKKILNWCLVVEMVISFALLIWGFVVGFESNDGQAVDILFYWAYIMVGLAVAAWVLVGGAVATKNDPKFLVKTGILLVAAAAICFVVYLVSPGNPAVGREGLDSFGTLKLTDTILNLTYVAGVAAIIAIIVGEVRMSIANRK